MSDIRNIHGRRGGRGVRPWLLLPKYFAVAMIVGGLAAVIVMMLAPAALDLTRDDQMLLGRLCARVFRYQIIPATLAAILLGSLLVLQHPRELLRARWLRVKLTLIIVAVPASHVLLRSQVLLQKQSPPSHVALVAGLSLTAFALIALIGRLKPRLAWRGGPTQDGRQSPA